jgi:hypothetical protein
VHNSFAARMAISSLIVLSFGLGYIFYGFVEVIQPTSPLIACGITGTLVLNLWAAWSLTNN